MSQGDLNIHFILKKYNELVIDYSNNLKDKSKTQRERKEYSIFLLKKIMFHRERYSDLFRKK